MTDSFGNSLENMQTKYAKMLPGKEISLIAAGFAVFVTASIYNSPGMIIVGGMMMFFGWVTLWTSF